MRVLHVINTAEIGGGGEHLVQLARGLMAHDCTSAVVVGRDGPAGARLREAGIPVTALGAMGAGTLLPLVRVMREQRPDVVHLHGSRAGLLGALSARAAGIRPVMYTAHAFAFRRKDYTVLRSVFVLAERATCALADQVICLTRGDLLSAKAAGIETRRASVIPNGIDLARFEVNGDRRALGIANEAPVIGMVGRLVPQKDPITFLRAARLVADAVPDARFLLIGDGPLRPLVEATVMKLGLETQCMVLGTRQDVPQLLAAMDVLLLTSRWEGLPYAALEAMAASKPVVASRLLGMDEVVDDGVTGILVDPGNAPEFAGAAIALLADVPRRVAMGSHARKRVADLYSAERMIISTLRVYHAALATLGQTAEVRST